MKEELELKLVEKYPKILKDYKGDMKETCMHWGMECSDGWFQLLDQCLAKIQHFCDLCQESGSNFQVVAEQIKEKFGSLRFYYDCSQDSVYDKMCSSIVRDIVSSTERESLSICEVSGEYGFLCKRGGWYKTLCREEARKLEYEPVKEDVKLWWKTQDEAEK